MKLTIGRRVAIAFTVLTAVQVMLAVAGVLEVMRSNEITSAVYRDQVVPLTTLARINELIQTNIQQLTIATVARSSVKNTQKYIDRVHVNIIKIDLFLKEGLARGASFEETPLYEDWLAKYAAFVKDGLQPTVEALNAQAFNDAEDIVLGVTVQRLSALQDSFQRLMEKNWHIAATLIAKAKSDFKY